MSRVEMPAIEGAGGEDSDDSGFVWFPIPRVSLGHFMVAFTVVTIAICLIARDYHAAYETARRECQVALAWSKQGAGAQYERYPMVTGQWQFYPRDFFDRVRELKFIRIGREPETCSLGSLDERRLLFDLAAELQELERLALTNTDFGDDDIPRLRALPRLTSLSLRGTRVTDRGMESLARFEQLTSIELNRTAITAAGVRYLLKMPGLTHLDLRDTGVKSLDVFREYDREKALSVLVSLDPETSIKGKDLQDFTAKHPRIQFLQVR